MTAAFADVDPVAIATATLRTSPAVLAEFGPNAVSGLTEPPFPHLRVAPSPAGDDGRWEWSTEAELIVEASGSLDGSPGRAELRRLLYVAVIELARLPEIPYVSGPVVTDVRSVGTAMWLPDPASGQPKWVSTIVMVAHPGTLAPPGP